MPYKNKEDRKEYDRQYRIANLEKIQEKQKRYGSRYYNKQTAKQYYIENIDKILERRKIYRLSGEFKVSLKKHKAKRRKLGFFALNEYFIGAEGHHISQNFVIYIPKELHRSISHNIWTGKNMEQINKLAVSFL